MFKGHSDFFFTQTRLYGQLISASQELSPEHRNSINDTVFMLGVYQDVNQEKVYVWKDRFWDLWKDFFQKIAGYRKTVIHLPPAPNKKAHWGV